MRKIILQIFIFLAIFLLIFEINRVFLQMHFLKGDLFVEYLSDIITMYILGAFTDTRVIIIAFLPLILIYFILALKALFIKLFASNLAIKTQTGGGIK